MKKSLSFEQCQKLWNYNEQLYRLYDKMWSYSTEVPIKVHDCLSDMEGILLDIDDILEPFNQRKKRIEEGLDQLEKEKNELLEMIRKMMP